MHLPPANCLRAFESAARHQSFTKAAAELNVTAAAISQHVRSLEAWLGAPLFSRYARGVSLTPVGKEFSTTVTYGLNQISLAAVQIKSKSSAQPVSLGCVASVTTRWLIPRLPLFRAVHPDIQINVVYALDAQTPEAIGVDLLIRHGTKPSAAAIPIMSAATRPTCAPSFVERCGPFATLRALKSTELLHDETTVAWARWFSTQGLSTKPSVGFQFADFNLLIGSVLAGQGVGLCPTALIQDELARGTLVTLFDHASDEDKSYWLMARGTLSREAKTLQDWLIIMSAD